MAVLKEAEEVIVEDAFTEDDCPKCPPQGAPHGCLLLQIWQLY